MNNVGSIRAEVNSSDEDESQSVTANSRRIPWLRHWPYVFAVISVLASIATGIPGLQGLSGAPLALAGFHLTVFLAVLFAVIGAVQQMHSALSAVQSELNAVHSQVSVVHGKEKSLRAAVAEIEQAANNLRSDVRCEFVGDDEAAARHLVNQCKGEALQEIRGTLVRSDENHRQYSAETYKVIEQSITEFLNRPDTYLGQIVGPKADKRLLDAYISASADVEKEGVDRVAWYRLYDETPILSFVILTYKEWGGTEKYREVLFGGFRYISESGEAVFKSKDERVVQEFSDLYEMLCQASERMQSKTLRERSNRGAIIHQIWDQSRLYKLLNTVEPGNEANGDDEGDVRICTTFFISYFDLRKEALKGLCAKGARIKILLMNPENSSLIEARFGLRTDKLTPQRAMHDLPVEIERLTEFPAIEVRVSDSMPCGFVVHTKSWAVVGLMPAHDSYVAGPMIETIAGTPMWQMLREDWNARWQVAKPYAVGKAANA